MDSVNLPVAVVLLQFALLPWLPPYAFPPAVFSLTLLIFLSAAAPYPCILCKLFLFASEGFYIALVLLLRDLSYGST